MLPDRSCEDEPVNELDNHFYSTFLSLNYLIHLSNTHSPNQLSITDNLLDLLVFLFAEGIRRKVGDQRTANSDAHHQAIRRQSVTQLGAQFGAHRDDRDLLRRRMLGGDFDQTFQHDSERDW